MAEALKAEILLVEPDPESGRAVLTFLRDRGYAAEWVDLGEKAFNLLDSRFFDVIITALTLPRTDGMRLMRVARERNPDICAVLIAEAPETGRATEAMREGARDYQIRPVNLEKLDAVIRQGLLLQRLRAEQVELKRRIDERFGLASLIGQSRQMARVYNAVRQIGPAGEDVLITGEPGTGKEIIAQALHNSSARRDAPFVKFDCAAVPDRVAERELFGELPAPGSAFVRGRFELADTGTLYLEAAGQLSDRLRGRVLQVLDAGEIARPGGRRVAVNVRIIAATEERPGAGAAGYADLLRKRLQAVMIEAPALRWRQNDIPMLAEAIISRAAKEKNTPARGITPAAMHVLMRYGWPGNIRELRNVIEGMAAGLRRPRMLDLEDLPDYLRRESAPDEEEIRIPPGTDMKNAERIMILETMRICGNDKEACARRLGIGLRTLYRKLKQYGGRA
jgi:DNA-binding NtrC family response regulator